MADEQQQERKIHTHRIALTIPSGDAEGIEVTIDLVDTSGRKIHAHKEAVTLPNSPENAEQIEVTIDLV